MYPTTTLHTLTTMVPMPTSTTMALPTTTTTSPPMILPMPMTTTTTLPMTMMTTPPTNATYDDHDDAAHDNDDITDGDNLAAPAVSTPAITHHSQSHTDAPSHRTRACRL